MIKTTKITEFKDNKKLTSDKSIINYNDPEFIYIPLFDNLGNYKTDLNINDYVNVGEVVAINEKFNIPIHSSISGFVIDLNRKMWINTGKMVSCIVIKNDYLNNSIINKENNNLNKELIIKLIQEKGIVGMGGAGFPTYLKYKNYDKINTLIVNGCECEPFLTCDYQLMLEETIKLINGIHYILNLINGNEAYIVIKEGKKQLYNVLNNYIDDKIRLIKVKDEYPVGYERYIVNKITKKDYINYPSEIGCVVNNVSTIISIYEAIKYNKPLIERIVTITGYCIQKPINVKCKIGTNISEIIDKICLPKNKYHIKHLTAGGIMTGKSMISNDIVVTKTLNGIIINPYLRKSKKVYVCIGCGKCANICPMKLTPTQLMHYYNLKQKEELIKLKANLCIQCGLCSYICPSRIDLMNFTSKAKELIKR